MRWILLLLTRAKTKRWGLNAHFCLQETVRTNATTLFNEINCKKFPNFESTWKLGKIFVTSYLVVIWKI